MEMANFYKKIKIVVQKFLFLISLSKPLSRIIIFTSGILILALIPTEKLHYLPVRSLYESFLHLKPYSSGITRAVSRLLHGDLVGAWKFNSLAYLLVPILSFILIKDITYIIRTRDFSI